MKSRRAADAISDSVIPVQDEARPADVQSIIEQSQATHVAVFAGNRFRGVVEIRRIAISRVERIFADLLDRFAPPSVVSAETRLDEVARIFEEESRDYVVVQEGNGEYLGTITQQSLLRSLLKWTRELSAEEEIRAEERFHSLLEAAPDAMLVVDDDGNVVQANKNAEKLFGYEHSGLNQVSIESLIPESRRARHVAHRAQYLANPGNRTMGEGIELTALRKDGNEFPVEISLNPLSEDASNYVVVAIRDISERKQAQEALAESERFNRATLDALSARMAVLDEAGNVVATNLTWRKFAQGNDTAWQTVAAGTNYLAICDRAAANGDEDAAAAAQAIRQVLAGERESWFHEYPCHAPHEERWFYCRVTRFPANGAVHVVVAHEDITAIKRAQEQRDVNLARYESLARVSPVGIILFDVAGKCIDVNRRWHEMTGFQREVALGDGWQATIHPEDRERVIRQWTSTLQDGRSFHSEHRLRPNNGHTVWVVCQAEKITTSLGAVTGYVRTLTDVTKRMRTEQALRLLSSDLAKLSGAAFYERIAVQLAELTQCDITAVCRSDPMASDRIATLAFCEDGAIQPNLNVSAAGTPCADVPAGGSRIIPRHVQQQYPHNAFLVDKQVEAYVGVPLITGAGQRLGHLAAMSRRPFRDPDDVEALLKLFSISVVAEMERQQLASRYSDLFEFSPDAIVITNRDGLIVQANRQTTTFFGWTPAELVGQPIEVLMPVDRRAGHPCLREVYLRSAVPRVMGSGRTDLLGLRKDGSVFPVDISLSPMQTTEGLLVAAAVRDITEHMRNEQQSRQQARLAEFSAMVGMALAEKGDLCRALQKCAEGVVQYLDAAFARIWTLNEEERVLELQASAGMYTHLDGPHARVPLGMDKIGLIAQEKQPHLTNSVCTDPRVSNQEWARREGMIAFAGYPLLVEDRIVGVLAMFSRAPLDASTLDCLGAVSNAIAQNIDRKHADAELGKLNLLLEQKIVERTVELTSANKKLVQISQYKSEFLATMSHELRTPLNGILGMNALLLTSELDDRQREYVTACNSSGKVLLQLINDVLDLSKIEAGKFELDFREQDLKLLFDDVVEIMTPPVRQKGLELYCHLAPEACVVAMCDDNRLRQVLVNLIGNAIKFTLQGSISLSMDRPCARDDKTWFRISVNDTGIGVPEERRHRLFQVFSQIDSSITRQYGGSGLGLSICKQLIELMGGQIGVESQIGVGSTFWFEIPLEIVDMATVSERRRQLVEQTPIRRFEQEKLAGHLLVAEDNRINQLYIVELLRFLGCTSDVVNNGEEALAAVQQTDYDLILMDCQMPEMDGFAATAEIRKKEAAGRLAGRRTIVALTANALKGDREKCLEAGMDEYVSKPVEGERLKAVLKEFLGRTSPPPPTSSEGI